jgi:SAM-dependent methyltransferase
MSWEDEQHWEIEWWGTCTNTFGEETKQITYAHRMGLINNPIGEHWPAYDLEGQSVLDIGAGPVSMLLKTRNGGALYATDPGDYPAWTEIRYSEVGIKSLRVKGEDLDTDPAIPVAPAFDEVWIYNCLQHVDDPRKIIENARKLGLLIRIFEWIEIPPCPGHPQMLHAAELDEWLGGRGIIEHMNENGCNGLAYYGVFET